MDNGKVVDYILELARVESTNFAISAYFMEGSRFDIRTRMSASKSAWSHSIILGKFSANFGLSGENPM